MKRPLMIRRERRARRSGRSVRPYQLLLPVMLAACVAPQTLAPQGDGAGLAAETERQRELVVRRMLDDEARLWRVAWPMLQAGAELCRGETRSSFGLLVARVDDFSADYRPAARRVLASAGAPVVWSVFPGSPAAAAGVAAGDQVAGVVAGMGEGRAGMSAPAGSSLALLDQGWPGRPVRLSLRRTAPAGDAAREVAVAAVMAPADSAEALNRGQLAAAPSADAAAAPPESLEIGMQPEQVCDYAVVLDEDSTVNAYADGDAIHVARGMLRFAETDDELAVMIGHELAHNAMGHIEAKQTNALAAGLGGLVIDVLLAAAGGNTGGAFTEAAMRAGAAAYSVEFEQEADYVGLYLVARAGYDISGAGELWRRLAAEEPSQIDHRGTHPTSPERFLAIDATRAEIERKVAAGLPLLPSIRPAEEREPPPRPAYPVDR